MKAVAFLLGIGILAFLISCAPKRPIEVVTATQNYVIGQLDETHFVIQSDNMATAQKAAEDVLACKQRPCLLSPGPVTLFVERPAQENPHNVHPKNNSAHR